MEFKSGLDFEDFVFGRHSDGERMRIKFFGWRPVFDRDAWSLIRNNPEIKHPNTLVGEDFFRRLDLKLRRRAIDTSGLVVLPTIGSMLDLRHYADCLIHLPAVSEFPITIDLFLIENNISRMLRGKWSEGLENYSFFDFQSDLFRWKTGRAKWLKDLQTARSEGYDLAEPDDFRFYVECCRPENHFIWTPQDVLRHGRKFFSTIFADYLANKIPCPKTALLSHK